MSNRICFTDEQRAAMRLLEGLINDGKLHLAPDKWAGGRLMFQQPRHSSAGGAPISARELGCKVCHVLGLDVSTITSVTIRMEANTTACVEVVRTVTRAEGEQITGALEAYELNRRGV